MACIKEQYLNLAEEIAQALLGPWHPNVYKTWRFSETASGPGIEPEVPRGFPENGWQQLALRIRDPFLSCYRGIHGPVGLYWLLPLLGAMHLQQRHDGNTPPSEWPEVHTVQVPCCTGNSTGVLLCDGVRLPCVWAPLIAAGPVEDVRVHRISEEESKTHAMMLQYHACVQSNQPSTQGTSGNWCFLSQAGQVVKRGSLVPVDL